MTDLFNNSKNELLRISREESAAYDRMELLTVLIGAYEAENLAGPGDVTPQQVVKFMAEQRNVSPGELASLMGGRSRLSDFYHKRRSLSTTQIINLREKLGIPADLLISRPAAARKKRRSAVAAH